MTAAQTPAVTPAQTPAPTRSTRAPSAAQLQATLAVSGALLSVAALLAWWPAHPVRVALVLLPCLGGLGLLIALQVLMVRLRASLHDPRHAPAWASLPGLWWEEWRHAGAVFGWRQPFARLAVPDQTQPVAGRARRGVVLVHGYLCNRGFWTPWLKRLQAQGRPFIAVDLEPLYGDISGYASAIDEAIERLRAQTGQAPWLLCHSMGGLAARAWWAQARRDHSSGARPAPTDRVWRLITLGSPHQGTWFARYSDSPNARQMRPHSAWLRELAHGEQDAPLGWVQCWHTPADNLVTPFGTATLPGADVRAVHGVAHIALAFSPAVMQDILAQFEAADPATASLGATGPGPRV